MAADGLLDLDTRQGKAMGGYCSTLPLRERAFIFMNGVGTHDNVQTMLHEAGHAFHAFESMAHTDLYWQQHADGVLRSGVDGDGATGCAESGA